MIVIRTVSDMRAFVRARPDAARLGFVPTMGALHEGHLSLMRMARLALRAIFESCVTRITVIPSSSFSLRNIWSTSTLVLESRFPVGSSAKSSRGRLISDLAMATRCCCPPDISRG